MSELPSFIATPRWPVVIGDVAPGGVNPMTPLVPDVAWHTFTSPSFRQMVFLVLLDQNQPLFDARTFTSAADALGAGSVMDTRTAAVAHTAARMLRVCLRLSIIPVLVRRSR
ncbi:MAG TPA: hypothetical protein VGB83_10020 [Actinomycetota bacterium]